MNDDGDPLLALLRQRYGDRWLIRRTEHLWIAATIDPDPPHAPTIVEPDVETFVRGLEAPPARSGRRSLLSAEFFRRELDRVRDGVYGDPRPPMT